MFTKYTIFFFLNILILKEVISEEIISKYGKKTTYNHYIYLDTSEFAKGDKIYISITTNFEYFFSPTLDCAFYENLNDRTARTFPVYYSSSSYVSSYTYYEETYNYKIEKTEENGNYLYIEHPFDPPVTIENTEKDASTTIIIVVVVVSFIVIVVFIIVIVCVCRRCRSTAAYGAGVVYPTPVAYGVSPYEVQPPIVMQPVVNVQPYGSTPIADPNYAYPPNVQNNQNIQGAPDEQGSEYRMAQGIK